MPLLRSFSYKTKFCTRENFFIIQDYYTKHLWDKEDLKLCNYASVIVACFQKFMSFLSRMNYFKIKDKL